MDALQYEDPLILSIMLQNAKQCRPEKSRLYHMLAQYYEYLSYIHNPSLLDRDHYMQIDDRPIPRPVITSRQTKEMRQIVQCDDLSKLKTFVITNPDFLHGRKGTLSIAYAAECASFECFRFFLLNGCAIDASVAHSAAKGGNEEIFQLVMEAGQPPLAGLAGAIESHRNHIANWIMESSSDDEKSVAISPAIASGNLAIVMELEDVIYSNLGQIYQIDVTSIQPHVRSYLENHFSIQLG